MIVIQVKITQGYVGIRVNLLGSDKGVNVEELPVGRYFPMWNEEIYKFPTFTQNYVWTKDACEGSPNDESITFQTKEGLSVNADVGISFAVQPDMVDTIFQKYRRGVDEITDTFLRNMVRDAFVHEAGGLPIEYVYGEGKGQLVEKVTLRVRNQVAEIGIINTIALPPGSEVLDVKIQKDQICMWVLLDTSKTTVYHRKFMIVGTGMYFDAKIKGSLGSVMTEDHNFVFHVFEVE